MKKFLCILMAMLMVGFTLTACAGKSKETNNTTAKTAGIKTLDDLNGKNVAVQNATTADDFAKAYIAKGKTNFQIMRYEKITQCYDDLDLGRVDAILLDEVVANYYASGKSKGKVVWRNDKGEPMGICLQKGSKDLAALVESAVDTAYFDGTMAKIATKYFGSDFSKGIRNVTAKPTLDLSKLKTIKKGTLTVGMEIGYPPMEFTTDDGKNYIGVDVELAQKIADLLGLKLEIKNTAWDGIFASLEKGEFDMIMSAVSITPERQAKYILTAPYISNRIVLVVPN